MSDSQYDVIIIGGSYAGLSAGMTLGRALRKVLIIDGGKPCNRYARAAHNFIGHESEAPGKILAEAKKQTLRYETIRFHEGLATEGRQDQNVFAIGTQAGEHFTSRKLLFASGVRDLFPEIEGFAECWGVSVLHCPYCHGYEVKDQVTGIIAHGESGFEMCRLISHWTKRLTLFANGKSSLTKEEQQQLDSRGIEVNEKEIVAFEHENGDIRHIVFSDGSATPLSTVYARIGVDQHCAIPRQLGCALTEHDFIQVDESQQTSVKGVFAAGDCTTMMRAIAVAIADGVKAGMAINKELLDEDF